MAGGDVYLSEMLKSLNANINALKTDMATMSGDMANVVAELINVKSAVSSGVTQLNVKTGDQSNTTVLTATEISHTGAQAKKIGFKCRCDGYITLNFEIKSSNASSAILLYYRKNGGSYIQIGTQSQSLTYEARTVQLQVALNDLIDIAITTTSQPGYMNAGANVGYQIIDIVNDGAVIVE